MRVGEGAVGVGAQGGVTGRPDKVDMTARAAQLERDRAGSSEVREWAVPEPAGMPKCESRSFAFAPAGKPMTVPAPRLVEGSRK